MPITDTLETSRKLEQAGFPPKQADVLSGLFEETARATQQDLKGFIVDQLAAMEKRLSERFDLRLETRIAQSESRLLRELRQQVFWFFGVQIAVTAALLGSIKLLFG